jgi:hypothetical protein
VGTVLRYCDRVRQRCFLESRVNSGARPGLMDNCAPLSSVREAEAKNPAGMGDMDY